MKQRTIHFFLALFFLLLSNVAKAEDVNVSLNAQNLASDETLEASIDLTGKTNVNLIFSLEEGTPLLTDEQILRISQFAKDNGQTVTAIDLRNITSITTLPSRTFDGANELTSIKLPALQKLSSNLFTNCSSLTNLTIGEWSNTEDNEGLEMETIPAGCFQGCSNLKHIYIKGVSAVEGWAFSGCTSMTEFPIKSIKAEAKVKIGSNAFENIPLSGSLTLPEGIVSVANNCFGSCLSLTDITFPATITDIDPAFDTNCQALTHIYVNDGNETYEALDGILYKKKNGALSLVRCPIANPEPIKIPANKNITEIAKEAFRDCKMQSITLNNGLLKIGENAFTNCKNLVSLTIPSSVTDIASSFVNGCDKLATLTIATGNSVYETIDKITYAKISIKEGETTTESKAIFRVPEAITLTDGKLNLSEVKGVTKVGNSAFEGVKELKELILPDDVTTLTDECFKSSGIVTFYVPKHLTEEGFGLAPFSECNYLTKFAGKDLDHFLIDQYGILYNKDNDKLFKIPNNYVTIGNDGIFDIWHNVKEVQACAFEGVRNIQVVNFAQGIKELPHRCFYNAKSVEKVLIPNSITTMGQDAFMGSGVKEVVMLTTTQTAPKSQNGNFNSFYGIDGNFKIHLSKDSEYGNFKDNWVSESEKFTSASEVERPSDGGLTQEEKDSRNYGWYGLSQANRLTTDIRHRALFESSSSIAGFDNAIRNSKDEHNNLSANTHYDYITLYRDFTSLKKENEGDPDKYATLALPVDVSKATLVNAFGANTKIWKFTGRQNNYINFESVNLNDKSDADIIIEKGVAVLISPEYTETSYLLQMNLGKQSQESSLSIVGNSINAEESTNAIDLNSEKMTSDGDITTIPTSSNWVYINNVKHDDIEFNHGFYATYQEKASMPAGSYYMTTNGDFKYATNSLRISKAFRGYIHGNEKDIESQYQGKATEASSKICIDGFTTSIDEVNIEGFEPQSYDIYHINGQLVRKDATSTEGLNKGIYIINGKKVIINK